MVIKNVMQLLYRDDLAEDGCDISYYQGDIDFVALKKSGIKAVIIRAGYGTTIDKRFISYINSAIKAGLAIGVYWFMYASDIASARNNARKCIQVIEPYRQNIVLGVWADWEYDSDKWAGTLSADMRSNIVDAFNCIIEEDGFEAGIYSNQDYIKSGKFQAWLVAKYPLWFAKYASRINGYAYAGKNGQPYLWQYSSSGDGKQHGVSSKSLDMNKVFVKLVPDMTASPVDNVSKDPETIRAIDNPYCEPTRTIFYTPEKFYMNGDDVKWVQWHLWRFGLFLDSVGTPDSSQVDGIWGKKSDSALAVAQKRLGLMADRKCGRLTREKFKMV